LPSLKIANPGILDGFKLMPGQSVPANQEGPLSGQRAALRENGRQTARSSKAIIHEIVRIDTGGNVAVVMKE
jgi:hypothetical protein